MTLYPFFRLDDERYTVYWDFLTDQQWAKRQAELKAEQERLRELEGRSVDVVRIGDAPSERDHNRQGERTAAGEFNGRRWRHATDGGWFSFEMKVLPDQPVDLLCTYWGSDGGNRVFDVLVDGQKIATQELNNNKPDQFFDVPYAIPEQLTRGKEKVTVRFQAQPGRWAGGVFGCRTARRTGANAPKDLIIAPAKE